MSWQSLSRYSTDSGARTTRRSLRKSSPPIARSSSIDWSSQELGSTICLVAGAQGCGTTLWRDETRANGAGPRVDWRCAAPVASVRARLADDEHFSGVGYAERLTMSALPWQLPLRQLRWGRWCDLDAKHSLVWIDWSGDAPGTWIYLNGERVKGAVTDNDVRGDDFTLALGHDRVLEQRLFADVVRGIPKLSRFVPRRMREMREDKWLSSGVLLHRDGRRIPGTSIHEVVTMG